MKTGTKIIIWTSVIAVLAVGGYMIYKQVQKDKEAEAKAEKRTQLFKDVGSFVSGIFSRIRSNGQTTTEKTDNSIV